MKAYENTIAAYKENKTQLTLLSSKLQNIKIEKEEIDKTYDLAKEKKDNDLPKLLVNEKMVSDAISEEEALKSIEAKISLLLNEKKALHIKIEEDSKKLLELEEEIKRYSAECENNQSEYDKLKIDEEFKVKVQKGILDEQRLSSIKMHLLRIKKKKRI